jgi:hypothetical protein
MVEESCSRALEDMVGGEKGFDRRKSSIGVAAVFLPSWVGSLKMRRKALHLKKMGVGELGEHRFRMSPCPVDEKYPF